MRFAGEGGGARCFEVLVREDRPIALAVAAATGVEHQSPQAILLSGGRAVWHASHGNVTVGALREACRACASGKGGG